MNDFSRERIVAIVRLLVMLVSAVAGGPDLIIDPPDEDEDENIEIDMDDHDLAPFGCI